VRPAGSGRRFPRERQLAAALQPICSSAGLRSARAESMVSTVSWAAAIPHSRDDAPRPAARARRRNRRSGRRRPGHVHQGPIGKSRICRRSRLLVQVGAARPREKRPPPGSRGGGCPPRPPLPKLRTRPGSRRAPAPSRDRGRRHRGATGSPRGAPPWESRRVGQHHAPRRSASAGTGWSGMLASTTQASKSLSRCPTRRPSRVEGVVDLHVGAAMTRRPSRSRTQVEAVGARRSAALPRCHAARCSWRAGSAPRHRCR